MRVFLGILLVCLSTLISYVLTNKFSLKRQFYDDFYNFNTTLKQEISFRQTTLISLLKNGGTTDFYLLLTEFIENNKANQNIKYLSNDEIESFYNYAKTLGAGDKDSQIEFLNEIGKSLLDKQKKCTQDEKNYKVLYIKLGFLLGLILFVLVL